MMTKPHNESGPQERRVRVGPRHCCPHHCVCPDNPEPQTHCDCSGKTAEQVAADLQEWWDRNA